MKMKKRMQIKSSYTVAIYRTSGHIINDDKVQLMTIKSIRDLLELMQEFDEEIILNFVTKSYLHKLTRQYEGFRIIGINTEDIDFLIEIYDDYRE